MQGIDLTGNKYGMLTVIEEADPVYYGKQRITADGSPCTNRTKIEEIKAIYNI